MKKITFLLAFWLLSGSIQAEPPVATESGKLLTDWIEVHIKLVRTTKGVGHVGFSRHFAYTSLAVYEAAVPAYKSYQSLQGQLKGLDIPGFTHRKTFSAAASINAAYAAMLKQLYSKNSSMFLIDSLEKHNMELFSKTGLSKDMIQVSADFGNSVVKSVLEWAAKDGAGNANAAYTIPAGAGFWKSTPPAFAAPAVPYWKNNRRMAGGDVSNFYTSAPPQYSAELHSAFYKMVADVYDVSQHLTDDQKRIALFWDDNPNGKYISVFGHWSSILSQVILSKKLSLIKAVESYVKMHLSLYDAGIVTWYGKYKYNLVRPITFIREHFNSEWNPLIETPSHPEFPAAHAILSSAAATALTQTLGIVSFTDSTYADLGMLPRRFSSFAEAAREAGLSRVYGGIHYRFSVKEGLAIGRKTADEVLKSLKFLKI